MVPSPDVMNRYAAPAHTVRGSAGPMVVHRYRRSASAGTAVVAHGRNGAADQPQMLPIVDACLDRALAVVAPDLCNSGANDSAGGAADFTMAAHIADVRTAMAFAAEVEPVRRGEPLLLIGHSMGAYAAVRIAAEAPPGTVSGVLAVSPVISGRALLAARQAMGGGALAALQAELPGAVTEWPQHDLATIAAGFKVPCAIIVGADDTLTTPRDAQTLASLLGTNTVYFDVVPGEHHCPLGKDYARSVGAALDRLLAASEQ